MPDKFIPEKRSIIMSRVKSGDTKPEKLVRSHLHCMGYGFRHRRKDLPGNPDIVLPKHRTVILLHGCFWHGHPGCPRAARPTTRVEFWNKKLDRNIKRDRHVQTELEAQGWRVLTIWQCQMRNLEALSEQLNQFLQEN